MAFGKDGSNFSKRGPSPENRILSPPPMSAGMNCEELNIDEYLLKVEGMYIRVESAEMQRPRWRLELQLRRAEGDKIL